MTWKHWVVVAYGIGALACSPSDEEAGGGAESGASAAAAGDSVAHHLAGGHPVAEDTSAHAGHALPGAPRDEDEHGLHGAASAADGHEGHRMPAADGARMDHGGHTPSRTAGAGGHVADAPAETDAAAHAGHAEDPVTPSQAHRHDASRELHADSTHAVHADTAHALHADTAHALHADTAHAMDGPAHQPDAHAAATAHQPDAHAAATAHQPMAHEMAMVALGGGWMAIGMAQAFPTATMSLPSDDGTPLDEVGLYVTQPALMLNLESPQSRVSFRTTLNFEGLTQPEGELTFGGWGEGFIDKRHPHTYLHEAMLSVNVWARDGGGFSLSAGKGFAPYGTDDPMSRPVVKYPTNHHLSQILERWTLNAVYSSPRWSVEAGAFGGNEPSSPTDLSNIESFANSWSARVARRFGTGAMGIWEWELSGSYGYVVEEHDAEESATRLYNVAFRHEHDHTFGRMYYLTEASLSDPEHHDGYWSVLGEGSLMLGAHNPYGRIEYATRPEYPRDGVPGTSDFFRYDHDAEPIGATRWLTLVAGYGFTATSLPFSARPFVEAQWHRVSEEEGGIDPDALFGRSSFFTLSAGFRLFLGGEPMRMGSYGVLDSMTLMHRMMMGEGPEHAGH